MNILTKVHTHMYMLHVESEAGQVHWKKIEITLNDAENVSRNNFFLL